MAIPIKVVMDVMLANTGSFTPGRVRFFEGFIDSASVTAFQNGAPLVGSQTSITAQFGGVTRARYVVCKFKTKGRLVLNGSQTIPIKVGADSAGFFYMEGSITSMKFINSASATTTFEYLVAGT